MRTTWLPAALLLTAINVGVADDDSGKGNLPVEVDGRVESAVDALFRTYTLTEGMRPIRERAGWRKPESIVVFVPNGGPLPVPDLAQWFQSAAPAARVQLVSDPSALGAAVKDADVVVLGDCRVLDPTTTRVRWIQQLYVGVERCLTQPLDWDHVLLTNTAGLSGPFIAEHAITMALMLTHNMSYYYRSQMQQRWTRDFEALASVRPVNGKTLLVLGLGGIGAKVAEKAAGLGMRVTAIRNSSRSGPDYVDYVGLSSELFELAAQADFIVNTLPLTADTTGLFDTAFFAAMKNSAYFITVGRGGSVVTEDLVKALESRVIAGAGLDVTDPEPLPASHVLWTMPNVLITPHSSSASGISSPDRFVLIRENIRRYANGEKMLNVVDPVLGY